MQIERIIYPVDTLGPGKRIVIWTIGCSKKCYNCISPELQQPNADKDIEADALVDIVLRIMDRNQVDGITISGGDPLEQIGDLLYFISSIHKRCGDILVYTGYTLKEIQELLTQEQYDFLKSNVAVLIDGRYEDKLNDNGMVLAGSINQTIHYFDHRVREKYEDYCRGNGRRIQNVFYGDKVISVGIHNKE